MKAYGQLGGSNSSVKGDFAANPPVEKLISTINCLRKSSEYCDVTILLDEAEYPAHKLMLASFSPYFKALLTGGFSESKNPSVKVEGIDASTMELVLDYAYGHSFKITSDNVESLMHAANFLQVDSLFKLCCTFLGTHLTAGNCLGIYHIARMYPCDELEEKTKEYMLKNFMAVCEEVVFLELDPDTLTDLIASDSLNVEQKDEHRVFHAVIKWLNYNEERAPSLPKILSEVRLAHIPLTTLYDHAGSVKAIRRSSLCMRLIENATWYQSLKNRQMELQSSISRRRRHWAQVEVMLIYAEHAGSQARAMICMAEDGRVVQNFPIPSATIESCYVTNTQLECVGVSYETMYRYTIAPHWATIGQMFPKRRHWFGFAELDGQWFAIGGMHSESGVCDDVDGMVNGTWKALAPLLIPVYHPAVVTLRGMIYVLGGLDNHVQPQTSVQRYDPLNDTWELLAPLPVKGGEFKACAIQDRIYVCQFFKNVPLVDKIDVSGHVFVYNVSTNQWSSCGQLSHSFVSGPVPFNGNMFVLTETLTEHGKKERVLEKFTPSSNTWKDFAKFRKYQPSLIAGPLLIGRPSSEYDPKGPLNFVELIK